MNNNVEFSSVTWRNKLIAEFMELPAEVLGTDNKIIYGLPEFEGTRLQHEISTKSICVEDDDNLYGYYAEELRYNKSWDWLMPVVAKIHSDMKVELRGVDVDVIIHSASQTHRYITLKIEYGRRFAEFTEYRGTTETMLEPVYRFVISFIKWHNDHKGVKNNEN